jgi:hypothetical protein
MASENRKKVSINKLTDANNALRQSHYNEIEIEKKTITEELERSKRYLIEEVRHDGEHLLNEIERREKKSVWSRLLDFIFK